MAVASGVSTHHNPCVEAQTAGPQPQVSDPLGLRMCIDDKFPRDVDTAGPGTSVQTTLLGRRNSAEGFGFVLNIVWNVGPRVNCLGTQQGTGRHKQVLQWREVGKT